MNWNDSILPTLELKDCISILKYHFKPNGVFRSFRFAMQIKRLAYLFLLRFFRSKAHKILPNLRHFILALPGECNLNCIGCYSSGNRNASNLTKEKIANFFIQSKKFVPLHYAIVGKGEPFLPKNENKTLQVIREASPSFISVFSHGGFYTDKHFQFFKKNPHILPIISLDGLEETHDGRRGKGSFHKIVKSLKQMKKNKIPCGVSVTICSGNFQEILSDAFMNFLKEHNVLLSLLFRYIAINAESKTDFWKALNPNEKLQYNHMLHSKIKNGHTFLFDSEYSEAQLGGCLSRQGKIIYADLEYGKLSPCIMLPFSPKHLEGKLFAENGLLESIRDTFFDNQRKSEKRICGPIYHSRLSELSELSDREKKEVDELKAALHSKKEFV